MHVSKINNIFNYHKNISENLNEISSEVIYTELLNLEKGVSYEVFNKNSSKEIYPGSLVKVFTFYLVFLNKINLKLKIKVFESDIVVGSGNNLVLNDEITINQLLKNMFFASSNTSAKILKRIIEDKTQKNFFHLVDDLLNEFKLKNTIILNEHGLFEKNQVTTAYDLIQTLKAMMINDKIKVFFERNLKKCEVCVNRLNVKTIVFRHQQKHESIIKTGSLFPNVFNSVVVSKVEGSLLISCLGYSSSKLSRIQDIEFLLKLVEI